jgi:hypothetical protein
MPNLFRALPSCVLALGVAGCGADAAPSPAAPPRRPRPLSSPPTPRTRSRWPSATPSRGSIAFIAERDGNKELYSVRPTGGGERRLTERPEQDFPATCSATAPGSW